MLKHYYLPSGKLRGKVYILAIVSVVGLLPIAWIYARLMLFAQFGPLFMVYSIGYGLICGRAIYLAAKWGKARNPDRMPRIGMAIGRCKWPPRPSWPEMSLKASSGTAPLAN